VRSIIVAEERIFSCALSHKSRRILGKCSNDADRSGGILTNSGSDKHGRVGREALRRLCRQPRVSGYPVPHLVVDIVREGFESSGRRRRIRGNRTSGSRIQVRREEYEQFLCRVRVFSLLAPLNWIVRYNDRTLVPIRSKCGRGAVRNRRV